METHFRNYIKKQINIFYEQHVCDYIKRLSSLQDIY